MRLFRAVLIGSFLSLVATPSFAALNTATPSYQLTGTTGGAANPVSVINTTTVGTEYGLVVRCASGCSSSAAFVDSGTFTIGTSAINNMGATFNDAAAALTAGQAGVLRSTANRGLHTNLRNAAGTELASLTTTPAGTELALLTRNIPSGTQAVSWSGQSVSVTTLPALVAGAATIGGVFGSAVPTTATFASAASNIAANNGTATLTGTGALTAAQPFEVERVRVTAPVTNWRCTIQYMNNTTPTILGYVSSQAPETKPARGAWRVASVGATGTQAIQAICNNLDPLNAQDFIVESDYCNGSGC